MTPRDTIAAAIAETISAHNDPMQAALAVMEMIEPKPLEWEHVAPYAIEAIGCRGVTYNVRTDNGLWRPLDGKHSYANAADANVAMEAVNADNLARFWASTPVGRGEKNDQQ